MRTSNLKLKEQIMTCFIWPEGYIAWDHSERRMVRLCVRPFKICVPSQRHLQTSRKRLDYNLVFHVLKYHLHVYLNTHVCSKSYFKIHLFLEDIQKAGGKWRSKIYDEKIRKRRRRKNETNETDENKRGRRRRKKDEKEERVRRKRRRRRRRMRNIYKSVTF